MDFNVIDYLAYHADVAIPAIILMVIVSAIYLFFYGIRPIKTRFLILFLLSIVSLIIFVLDNPLYYYLGSPYSGLLFPVNSTLSLFPIPQLREIMASFTTFFTLVFFSLINAFISS